MNRRHCRWAGRRVGGVDVELTLDHQVGGGFYGIAKFIRRSTSGADDQGGRGRPRVGTRAGNAGEIKRIPQGRIEQVGNVVIFHLRLTGTRRIGRSGDLVVGTGLHREAAFDEGRGVGIAHRVARLVGH